MPSGGQKKKYDTNYTPSNEVTLRYHYPSKYNNNTGMGEKFKWKMNPKLIISAVTSKTQDDLPTEELTSPYEIPTEEPTSDLASEPNGYSPSGHPSCLPSPLTSNLPLYVTFSYPQYARSDSPRGDTSIFPVPDPTTMFQKSLQKSQMVLPVVDNSLSYSHEPAILQLESRKMLIQDTASFYPTDISDYNEYLI